MMKLKHLVIDTYSVAERVLEKWEYDKDTLSFWRGSSNFVYRFESQGEKYFLRFSHEEENSLEQITAEIEFLLYLNRNHYPANRPILSKERQYIETIQTESGKYYAVVFTEVKGVSLDIDTLSKEQFEAWGKALANLHILSDRYVPNYPLRKTWKDMIQEAGCILKDFPQQKETLSVVAEIEFWLSSLPMDSENYGLVHYDFELDNTLWDEETKQFNIIDFDDAVYHWYVMDIVCALRDLNELDESKREEALQSFLCGYRSIKKINDDFIQWIPKFKIFENIYTFSRLLRTLQDSNFDKDPEWLTFVRPKLIKKCEELRSNIFHAKNLFPASFK